MSQATIAAIATPYGSGSIGVIRISGDAAIKISEKIFRRSGGGQKLKIQGACEPLRSHRLYHGHIIDTETQTRIDEVLLAVMKAPKSYTREDVVEIQSHSGYVVLSRLFETVLKAGARIAAPGEFTKRAFLNGRIDLTQAEAVIDTINAKSGASLRIAARQMEGHLKAHIERIWKELQAILVELEAAIDFPDESGGGIQGAAILARFKGNIVPDLEMLLRCYQQGRHFREGVRMAVVGRPNVGKSSLLNCLVEKDRAIVSAIPGTTRDVIEETVTINGLPVIIMDTAGLQETEGEVERRGIEKTLESIQHADIILFVIDASRDIGEEDRRIYETVRPKPHIIVQNKIDLVPSMRRTEDLPQTWEQGSRIKISARDGLHVGALKELIEKILVGGQGVIDVLDVVPNARHKEKIELALSAVKQAAEELQTTSAVETAVIDIRDGMEQLEEILGYQWNNDILEQVFSRFCIGK